MQYSAKVFMPWTTYSVFSLINQHKVVADQEIGNTVSSLLFRARLVSETMMWNLVVSWCGDVFLQVEDYAHWKTVSWALYKSGVLRRVARGKCLFVVCHKRYKGHSKHVEKGGLVKHWINHSHGGSIMLLGNVFSQVSPGRTPVRRHRTQENGDKFNIPTVQSPIT